MQNNLQFGINTEVFILTEVCKIIPVIGRGGL
jgi:hypothetical protein